MSPESDFHDPRDRDMRSEFSSDSIEQHPHHEMASPHERQFDRAQMQWLEDLKARRAKIVQVVYPRTANNEKELTVIRDEILEVLDDSRKWWKARNMRGQVAHVPHTIVSPYPSVDDDVFNNPVYGSNARGSRDNFYSTETSPVNLEEGTTRVQDTSRSPTGGLARPAPADWVRRERQGRDVFAENFYKDDQLPLPPPPRDFRLSQTIHSSPPPPWFPPPPDFDESPINRRSNPLDSTKYSPELPTTLPRLTPSRNPKLKSNNGYSVSEAALELFQEELKNSIAQKRGLKLWNKTTCPEHGITDCFYISHKSKQSDVMHWLTLKGFSEIALDVLRPMSAEMLFNLKKDQLEKHLGDEGTKLHSHLVAQKNLSGYKTCTSQELNQILAGRRQKADEV